MKIVKGFPPNYEIITLALNPNKDTIFCYGDTIYNPTGRKLTPDIEHHESIHSKQQGGDPESWWNRYISNKNFRLLEEIEAYGEQYIFAKEHGVKGRLLEWALDKMAESLSSEVYGNLISYGSAKSKIRNYGKNR